MHQRLQSNTFFSFKEKASFQFPLFSFSIYIKTFWRIDHGTGSFLASHFSGSTPIIFALIKDNHPELDITYSTSTQSLIHNRKLFSP